MGRPKGAKNKKAVTKVAAVKESVDAADAADCCMEFKKRQDANVADLAVEVLKIKNDLIAITNAFNNMGSGIGQMSQAISKDMQDVSARVTAVENLVFSPKATTVTGETAKAAITAIAGAAKPTLVKTESPSAEKVTSLL